MPVFSKSRDKGSLARSGLITVFSAYISRASSPRLDPDFADDSMGEKFPDLVCFYDSNTFLSSIDSFPAESVAKCNQFFHDCREGNTDVGVFKQVMTIRELRMHSSALGEGIPLTIFITLLLGHGRDLVRVLGTCAQK